ncbi:hypothetical protein ACFU7Y_37530 [Kitasatospora sp. NPDC057542]|uniref:hypothetical protein n=1 Tax=Streptomycetaceae TaxID=2062 RepID=UPI001CCC841C|nr:hypothetical protein [Streptomyces sp. LS1784]
MKPGTATFLVGAAFAVLLALAFATVALGVVAVLRMPRPDEQTAIEPEHRGPAGGMPA